MQNHRPGLLIFFVIGAVSCIVGVCLAFQSIYRDLAWDTVVVSVKSISEGETVCKSEGTSQRRKTKRKTRVVKEYPCLKFTAYASEHNQDGTISPENEITFPAGSSHLGDAKKPSYYIGQQVMILRNPNNVKQIEIKDSSRYYGPMGFMFIGCIFALFSGLMLTKIR